MVSCLETVTFTKVPIMSLIYNHFMIYLFDNVFEGLDVVCRQQVTGYRKKAFTMSTDNYFETRQQ